MEIVYMLKNLLPISVRHFRSLEHHCLKRLKPTRVHTKKAYFLLLFSKKKNSLSAHGIFRLGIQIFHYFKLNSNNLFEIRTLFK